MTIQSRTREQWCWRPPRHPPRIFRLRSSQAHVRAGVTAVLRVKLNAVQLQAVRKSLRAGKRVRIRLIVLATDVEGNRTNAIPAITLTRRNLR